MTTPPLTIVYDLDGTLADTAPDLLATLNTILKRSGFKMVEPQLVGHLVGRGARAMIERALKSFGRTPDPETIDRLFEEFLDYYVDNITREGSALYPGVAETLIGFDEGGIIQGVCTNKFQRGADLMLRNLNIHHHFKAVLGGNALKTRKPDPHHVLETIRRAGGDPARALMIGDSATDLNAARAAHVPCILVDYGYSDTPVDALDPDAVISHFGEIEGLIPTLTKA